MSRAIVFFCVLSAVFVVVGDAHADEILDNAAIVRMVSAGLAADIIELKIERTAGRFDVSADALIALKNARVPDGVIKAMMLKDLTATSSTAVSAPVLTDATCANVSYFTLGNEGWSWVPSYVCVTNDALVIDQQRIPIERVTAECREKSLSLAFGGDIAEWWFSDGVDTYKFRASQRLISDLEAATLKIKPGVPHGSCSDRPIRKLLAGRP
jgi:hypothetical protein